ncbi:MAG: dethiobiotin synthase, partial [Betaproteobacteria bacterium]
VSPGAVFITGTDTGVGKTRVAQALLRAHVAAGRRAVGMKPVAAGIGPGESVNADVAALARAGNVDAPLADRNPYAFAPAVAPHLAAAATGVAIDLATIAAAYARLAARADVVIVEGAGGALVPLDARHDMLDIALCLRLPVLLVVGLRVGCLNHAFLSERAIRARGLVLAGWVANAIGPGMVLQDENVAALSRRLAAPCFAVVGHGAFPQLPSPWLPGVEPC